METSDKGFELLFSFFDESDQIAYQTPHELISQSNNDSCVAACVQMVLTDFGIYESQNYLASALETRRGAFLSKVPSVLREFEITGFQWQKNLTLTALLNSLESNSAIVSLQRKNTKFGHSVIADDIIDDTMRLRDPLPRGQGKSYAVALETFMGVWLKSGVIYVK